MSRKVLFSITAILLLIAGVSFYGEAGGAQVKRPDTIGDLTGRDAVGFRKDKVTKESVGERPDFRPPSTKQAMQDFREIQELNITLKRASKESPLAFENLMETAKRMGVVANRLNSLLVLPKPKQKPEFARVETTEEFLQQIEDMNSSVKAFVTNPLFRQVTDSNRDLPREAGENLGKVIVLSKSLEEGALKLSGKR